MYTCMYASRDITVEHIWRQRYVQTENNNPIAAIQCYMSPYDRNELTLYGALA